MAVTLAILPPSWVPGKQSAIYTVKKNAFWPLVLLLPITGGRHSPRKGAHTISLSLHALPCLSRSSPQRPTPQIRAAAQPASPFLRTLSVGIAPRNVL